MAPSTLTPEVTWAQRSSSSDAEKNFLYVNISASDVPKEKMNVDIQASSVTFKGYSNSKDSTYEVTLELYGEIDPANSHVKHSARDVEMKLQKKELNAEFWPRLLTDKRKAHFLRTDFDKWVDEDEQETKEDDDFANFGGGNPAGGGFEGLDFSKLGGGGAGMPEMPTGGSDDEEDDDMPDLDDEEATEKTETGSSAQKIPEATGETGASATKTSGGAVIEEIE